MSVGHVVGIDVGSTYVKGVLVGPDDGEVARARRPTPWQDLPAGRTEMAAGDLFAVVDDVLTELARHGAPVAAIGVAGMAEAGLLVDADDEVVAPVVAWFDPRGDDALADLPDALREQFPARTGLPLTPLATFTKLWHRSRHEGLRLHGRQWLSVPEAVAWSLGAERRCEVSLAARTGLLDQESGQPWAAATDTLGAGDDLLPPVTAAGSVWGSATRRVPTAMSGAVLTVAGHDDLVSSVAAGVLDTDTLYDSIGTAEALVRVLDDVLDEAARSRLAGHGVNVVRHLLPGRGALVAGTRSGLLLRRALQLVGVLDDDARRRLDDEVMGLEDTPVAGSISVWGAVGTESVLHIRAAHDGLSPALLFEAALRHSSEVLVALLEQMDAETTPAGQSVVAGGWADMRSVRRSRAAILPSPQLCASTQDTAYGAALVAAFAADEGALDLVDHLRRHTVARGATG